MQLEQLRKKIKPYDGKGMDEVVEYFIEATHQATIAAVIEIVEGMKTEEPLYVGKTQYEFYKGDIRWVANQALSDVQALLTPKK
jgi:hypothetical protein